MSRPTTPTKLQYPSHFKTGVQKSKINSLFFLVCSVGSNLTTAATQATAGGRSHQAFSSSLVLRRLASIILEHYRPLQARDRVQFGEAEECFYYYIITREIYRRILIQEDVRKEDKIHYIR